MLENFIVAAKECAQSDNLEDRCGKLLFPFICDALGYSVESGEDLVSRVTFGANKDEFLEYSIKNSNSDEPNSYILGIKIVSPGESFAEQRHVVERCLIMNPKVKYGVITDCVNFEFYENLLDKGESVGIKLVNEMDLTAPTRDDDDFIRLLVKKGFQVDGDSISDDDVFDNTNTNEEQEKEGPPIVIGDEKKPQKKQEKKKVDIDIKKYAIPVIGAIVAIVLIWLLWGMFGKGETVDSETPPGWDGTVDWSTLNNVDSSRGTNSTLAYINLQAMLSTKRYGDDSVEASLLNTNIDDGAKIKFVFQCGEYSGSAYGTIKNGECSAKFNIPAEWYEPQVTVIAYMRFDEVGEYVQTDKIKNKYGDDGELVIWEVGAPKYAVTYTVMTHENAAVIKYINDGILNQQNEIKARRDRDFAKTESLVDVKGNIKIVPDGFSIVKENITETRHIYPFIYYDAAKGRSFFYITAGYVGRDWIEFNSVNIFADTYKWGYEISSNEKRRQVGGMALSEWVYYTDESVLNLLNDMTLLAASNETSIRLSGPIKKTFVITQEEKDNIKFFLYLYETYFGNGTITPDVEWFNVKGDVIVLDYLKKATEVRMRNSEQILDMEALQASINQKRANGAMVSSNDTAMIDQMSKTFKPVSDEIYDVLYKTTVSADAYQVYDTDDEHGNNSYMKFYFTYDKDDVTIEDGYIPYMVLYRDGRVQLPIVSSANSSYTTKTLAEFSISQDLYNNIATEMGRATYMYFGEASAVIDNPEPVTTQTPQNKNDNNPYEGFVFEF